MVQFVENLSSQYSPLIVELQSNASFNLGELVRQGDSAAIHIFAATFDSLIGPQFRYACNKNCPLASVSIPV